MSDTLKSAGDFGAFGIAIAAIVDILPAASAALSLVYIAIRIYETDTVRRWLGRS
jgi:hypothetical protein